MAPSGSSLATPTGIELKRTFTELHAQPKLDTNLDVAAPTIQALEQERDLYRRVLELGSKEDIRPFVEDALALLCDATGAHQGYLELHSDDGDETLSWHAAHGFSDEQIERVREDISSGIIAEAMATGETVVTRSALTDERFNARESVRGAQIQAVLCTPIGSDPVLGILYLQRRLDPGPFADTTVQLAETVARHLTPYADRLLTRETQARGTDATREARDGLRAHEGLVGRSPALARVLADVAVASPLNVGVLLTGSSGTGKTDVARLIHENSRRAGRRFIELNCNAIPEALVESELFGALPGSHSMATKRIDGKVAAAEGGTLFLDEIGDLPLAAQGKLLQLLQSRQYFPLGSTNAYVADIRIIAATNTDLEVAVQEGKFREDLFYRLNVLAIRLPTLAERREDIPLLASYFLDAACVRHELPRLCLSSDLVRALETAEWPGNVRQLAHAIESAAIRTPQTGGLQIERSSIFPKGAEPPAPTGGEDAGLTFQEATRQFQAKLLRTTFEDTGWNILEASRRLELTRSHVYTLIKAFGIERKR